MVNHWPFHSLFIIDMCSTYEYRLTACCCSHFSRLSIQKPLVGCTSHTGFHYPCKCQCQSSVWHHGKSGRGTRWEVWGLQGRVRPKEHGHYCGVKTFHTDLNFLVLASYRRDKPVEKHQEKKVLSSPVAVWCSCKDIICYLQRTTFFALLICIHRHTKLKTEENWIIVS